MANFLDSHPEIQLSINKEPHFFSRNYGKGFDFYHGHFSPKGGVKIYMEASTSYTFYPVYKEVPERIFNYNPDMKLIYIVREPSARIISNYNHRFSKRATKLGFREEVFSNPNYFFTSDYSLQLKNYSPFFQMDQMLILVMEQFLKAPETEFQRLREFLGLDQSFEDLGALPRLNSADEKNKVPNKVLKFLESGIGRILPYRVKRTVKDFYLRNTPIAPNISVADREFLFLILGSHRRRFKEIFPVIDERWSRFIK